jgi:hypothetical protein
VRAPDVGFIDADGEAILVAEATGELHLLNRSAALLWQCFDDESSLADICFDLADVLGVPFERALTDTLEVVDGLAAQVLVYDGRGSGPTGPGHEPELRTTELEIPRRPGLLEEPPGG